MKKQQQIESSLKAIEKIQAALNNWKKAYSQGKVSSYSYNKFVRSAEVRISYFTSIIG